MGEGRINTYRDGNTLIATDAHSRYMEPALLIIDMQNDFVRPDGVMPVAGAEAIVEPVRRVLEAFRTRGLPVFHVVRVHRPDGSDVEIIRRERFQKTPFAVAGSPGAAVIDELAPRKEEYLIPKIRMSAFLFTDLDQVLRTLGVDTVVVAGLQTPNCIRTTVYDAMSYGYATFLVDDAVAARTPEIHRANVRDMEDAGIGIITTRDVDGLLDR